MSGSASAADKQSYEEDYILSAKDVIKLLTIWGCVKVQSRGLDGEQCHMVSCHGVTLTRWSA